MKLIQSVKNKGNLASVKNIESKETTEFQIGDVGKIIEILRSKIYSNPIQTLVQEYLCNARDAVREVGGSKIQVTLPTFNDDDASSESFKVRDFGPGISRDRMKNVFVHYGNTTKASSANQTGGFGLGAKLAWAYTDTFNITTFIDGVKTSYMAHIGANKNGCLELISEDKTEEANGTEISLDVQAEDSKQFIDAVHRAVALWKDSEKPEIVNSSIFEQQAVTVNKITEGLSIYFDSELARHGFTKDDLKSNVVLSIDGVAYGLSEQFVRDNKALQSLAEYLGEDAVAVLSIGNGQVEIAASRESISENERTAKTVSSKASAGLKALKELVNERLNTPTTLGEFIRVANHISDLAQVRISRTFNGHDFEVEANRSWEYNRGYGRDSVRVKTLSLKSKRFQDLSRSIYERDGSKTNVKTGSWRSESISLNTLFLYKDETLSMAKQNAKVMQELKRSSFNTATLLSSEPLDFNSYLGTELEGIALSTVTLPKTERAESNRLPKGVIKAQLFKSGGYGDRKFTVEMTIDLEAPGNKYVYLNESEREKVDHYDSLRNFIDLMDRKLIGLTPGSIKQIQGNESFESLESVLANLEKIAGKKLYKLAVHNACRLHVGSLAGNLEGLVTTPKAVAMLKDTYLATELKFIHDVTKNSDDERIYLKSSDDVLNKFLNDSNETVKHAKLLNDTFNGYVNKTYPILRSIRNDLDWNYDSDEPKDALKAETFFTEIVTYINAKVESK